MSTKSIRLRLHNMFALLLVLALTGSFAGQVVPRVAVAPATPGSPATAQQTAAKLAQGALSFEANKGQTDPAVRYLAHGDGYTVFFTDQDAVLVTTPDSSTGSQSASQPTVLHYRPQGNARTAGPVGAQALPGKVNYFMGNDPARWQTDVPTFGQVVYSQVYPGIDLAYRGTRAALEYDFIVGAGADPSQIRLSITGAEQIALDNGDLVLHTAQGTIRQTAPHIYQETASGRQDVSGGFALLDGGTVGFHIGAYDASRPVVIDPTTIVWSSYLGGSNAPPRTNHGGDWLTAVTTDSSNNVYVTGTSNAPNYPTVNPFQSTITEFYDVVVTKIMSDGTSLAWSTYIGGTHNGPDPYDQDDYRSIGHGIVLDGSNNVYISGFTNSDLYPTTPGAYNTAINNPTPPGASIYDAIITKLSSTGDSLVYSTFVGGSGQDFGYNIALDASNNAYIIGGTTSSDFPASLGFQTSLAGAWDAFVFKLDPTGSFRVYGTYLGGSANEMRPLPGNPGDLYFGSTNPEDAVYREAGIKVDGSGNAYVTGYTESGDFPTTPNAYMTSLNPSASAFFTELNAAGNGELYSTYYAPLASYGTTRASDLAMDSSGNVYITGFTDVNDINGDAFVAKFDPTQSGNASLIYSRIIGGTDTDRGFGIYVDPQNEAEIIGQSFSTDYPTTPDAYQPTKAGAALDVVVSVLNATGSGLVYSTYIGFTGNDQGTSLTVDPLGHLVLVGATQSTNFVTTPNVFRPTAPGGKSDGFVMKLTFTTPTAVQVSAMAAAPAAGGGVDVQWASAAEADHLGFRLLSGPGPNGPFAPVSAQLLTAWSAAGGGSTYRFHDPAGTAHSWYRVEAVDTHSGTQRFAAFPVGKQLPALSAGADAGQQAAAGAAFAKANAQALAQLPHPALVTTPYKLLVSQSGVTRITYEQLQAAGVPLDGVNPDYLTLTTGAAGARTEVPLALHVATPGQFAPGDWFEFVAQAAPSVHGDARAYYLAVSSQPGARMQTAGGGPGWLRAATFPSTLHLEENHYYWLYWHDQGNAQPEGPWYWAYALNDSDAQATLNVPDVAPGVASNITVNLQGFTEDPAAKTDHHVAVSLNGTALGELRWHGMLAEHLTATVPAGLLHSGANSLQVHNVGDTGESYEGVWLTSADVSYSRYMRAAGDALSLKAVGGSSVTVGGFTSRDVVLYDVTRPEAPVAVQAQVMSADGGFALTAHVPGSGTRQLLAAGPAGLVPVDSIAPVSTADLAHGGADYVVIAYDSMLAAGQQLAALHAGAGLRTAVVPVSAIFDQFGSGAPDSAAITAFLATTVRQWNPAPHYVVLLGSANTDAHNYLGNGALDLVPTGYVDTTYMGQTASDVSLVPAGAQMALGRLPARSPAEASAVVAKLVGYAGTAHQWGAQAGLVSDAAEAGSFDDASEALARGLDGWSVNRIYESQYGANTTQQIVDSLNAGQALLNYYGHSSFTYWGGDQLFSTGTLGLLHNAGREAFVTSLTCYTGDYAWADSTALLTALVLQPSGGAIGGLGGSAISNTPGQVQLNTAFYAGVRAGLPVGDALLAAQAATRDPEVAVQFQLLGDPALRIDVGR